MATIDCTLGTRFAGSKFLAKPYSYHSVEHLTCNSGACCSSFLHYHHLDSTLAELMETLRLHMNDVLRLPFSAQKRSRLVRNHWEVELLVKEMRLLLDPVVLNNLFFEMMLREGLQDGGDESP